MRQLDTLCHPVRRLSVPTLFLPPIPLPAFPPASHNTTIRHPDLPSLHRTAAAAQESLGEKVVSAPPWPGVVSRRNAGHTHVLWLCLSSLRVLTRPGIPCMRGLLGARRVEEDDGGFVFTLSAVTFHEQRRQHHVSGTLYSLSMPVGFLIA